MNASSSINGTGFMIKKEVLNLAKEKYGDLAGLAQQYLFYWKREA